jgi:hypothetical protein
MANQFQLPSAAGSTGEVSSIRPKQNIGAFTNISLARADGTVGKIGDGLRMNFDDPGMVALAEMLQTPEGIEKFRAAIIITCNYNKPASSKAEFVL